MPFIYVIGPENGPYKVGVTTSVEARLSALQTGNHQELMVHRRYEADNLTSAGMQVVERRIHRVLKQVNIRGEWFSCDLPLIEQVIAVTGPSFKTEGEGARRRILDTLHEMEKLNSANGLA